MCGSLLLEGKMQFVVLCTSTHEKKERSKRVLAGTHNAVVEGVSEGVSEGVGEGVRERESVCVCVSV